MGDIRKSYGEILSKYNVIKNKIKIGSLEHQLINDFGDSETKEAFKILISQDLLNEVKSFKNTQNLLNFGKKLGVRSAEGAAIVGGGGLLANQFFGRK